MSSPTVLVASWSDGVYVGTGVALHRELVGESVKAPASDGRGGALAIVGGRSLRRRTAESDWVTLATAASDLSCCVAVGEFIYVGTEDARILRLGPGAALDQVTAFDDVAGRDTWYAGTAVVDGRVVGPPLGVRSLSATCDGAVLLANVHVGGIPRSLDQGATWHATIDIDADVHQVCAHPSRPELVIAAAAVGLCVSRDGGASWTIERDGLHAPHCSAVAFVDGDILISASEDPFSARGAVYRRSIDGHGALERVGGLPEWTEGRVDTGCIGVRGSAVAAVDAAGRLYLSADAGRTWVCGSDLVPNPGGILVS